MKKGYVNYVEIERYFYNREVGKRLLNDKKITPIDCGSLIDQLHQRRILKMKDEYDVKSDKYLIPVNVYAVVMSDPDNIYVVDEFTGANKDCVDFLGGQISNNISRYRSGEDYLINEFINNAYRQLTRSGEPKPYITTIRGQLQDYMTVMNSNPIRFSSCYYNISECPGLYLLAPILIEPCGNSDYLIPYNRLTHRLFINMRDKSNWSLKIMQTELQVTAKYDCRYSKFDLATEMFRSIQRS